MTTLTNNNNNNDEEQEDKAVTVSVMKPKQRPKTGGGGLSELSKQLRVMQAKNQQHEVEIDRLERQLKILADLQGISIADLRSALEAACESEAHGELQHRVASLRAQLEAATTLASKQDTKKFEESAAEAHVANLQLRVGELEELEETLRAEIKSLYDKLQEQTAKATQLEATCESQKDEIEKLKEAAVTAVSQQPSQALVPVEATPVTPHAEMSPADIKLLKGEARTAKAEAKMERDKVALLEQQLEAREEELKLRTAQYKARFAVQDERINDLEQQLSSLYTAFELLRQEQQSEQQQRASLEENLHNADAQVARDLEMQSNMRSVTATRVTTTTPPQRDARLAAGSRQPQGGSAGNLSPQKTQQSKRAPPQAAATSRSSPRRSQPATAALSSPQQNAELVVAGSLMVRSNEVLKRWKKRYCALYRNFAGYQLTMTDKDRAVVGKTYDLQVGVSCARQNKQFAPKYPYAFVLHVDPQDNSAPVIHAAAGSQETLRNWLSELRIALDVNESTPVAGAASGAEIGRTRSMEEQEAAELEAALRLSAQEQYEHDLL